MFHAIWEFAISEDHVAQSEIIIMETNLQTVTQPADGEISPANVSRTVSCTY